MNRFPVLMEELICKARFLVEKDHGSEVGLLVGAFFDLKFVESEAMSVVIWAFHYN
jgi:hypothetical protein